MRIRKVTEPFKNLSGEPVKVVNVNDFKQCESKPATVTPISRAACYNHETKKTG
jgi:hypothetical protein